VPVTTAVKPRSALVPEAIVTSRITVMDADEEPDQQVRVQRHVYDFNDLAGEVGQRLTTIIHAPAGCHYLNPAVTVSCSQPTPGFFAVVRREQARWCRTASDSIKKRERRRVKTWVCLEPATTKYARYLNRAACLTGLLFIDGEMVPHHRWPASSPLTVVVLNPQ